jgi:hypothetical protein
MTEHIDNQTQHMNKTFDQILDRIHEFKTSPLKEDGQLQVQHTQI